MDVGDPQSENGQDRDCIFVNTARREIVKFLRDDIKSSALVFPALSNRLRFLTHKIVEEEFQDLCTFSVGKSDLRRPTVCFKSRVVSAFVNNICTLETARTLVPKLHEEIPGHKWQRMERDGETARTKVEIVSSKARRRRPDRQLYVPRGRALAQDMPPSALSVKAKDKSCSFTRDPAPKRNDTRPMSKQECKSVNSKMLECLQEQRTMESSWTEYAQHLPLNEVSVICKEDENQIVKMSEVVLTPVQPVCYRLSEHCYDQLLGDKTIPNAVQDGREQHFARKISSCIDQHDASKSRNVERNETGVEPSMAVQVVGACAKFLKVCEGDNTSLVASSSQNMLTCGGYRQHADSKQSCQNHGELTVDECLNDPGIQQYQQEDHDRIQPQQEAQQDVKDEECLHDKVQYQPDGHYHVQGELQGHEHEEHDVQPVMSSAGVGSLEDGQTLELSYKHRKDSKLSMNQEEELTEDSWDVMFDDSGECLDPAALQELTQALGEIHVRHAELDYTKFEIPIPNLTEEEYGHILEIYGFPAEFETKDLVLGLSSLNDPAFTIKWVDDTHALAVFSSPLAASEALAARTPLLKIRHVSEASRQSKLKVKRCAEFMQPFKPRPQTSASVARRLVSGALGLRVQVQPEQRRRELQAIKEAKRVDPTLDFQMPRNTSCQDAAIIH
ncbi:R3H and coiled-coil domain-containing protein 1-like isoform X2 [Ornithodoros turicata]|uniref:R3H and coiled-coil domain-containing protein 1-like isoform X2 n=1 Tax=Ornithodoros turicata TaxID=34597 RepID=UPI0031391536